jgi:DNA-binding response OmpR family regulator
VRLTVQDTGAGIPAAALPHVFKRFYRAPELAARSIEGTGIGLALVLEFVQALEGDVGVASEHGTGSTFTVEIPFEGTPAAPATARADHAATSGAETAAFVQEAVSWTEPRSPHPEQRPLLQLPQGRSRVLVVEDNPDMRQYLVQVLRREYEVSAVADGQAAVEAIAASPPDLVVSDIVMPGLNGLALVRALRAHSSTCAIPVILVTARAGEDAALEGLGSRADDYVVKPFSSRELLARVQTHLELARVRREAVEAAMKDAFIGVVSHELRTPAHEHQASSAAAGRLDRERGAPERSRLRCPAARGDPHGAPRRRLAQSIGHHERDVHGASRAGRPSQLLQQRCPGAFDPREARGIARPAP